MQFAKGEDSEAVHARAFILLRLWHHVTAVHVIPTTLRVYINSLIELK
jgi:hypothetical protein